MSYHSPSQAMSAIGVGILTSSSFFLVFLVSNVVAVSLSFNLPTISPSDSAKNIITLGNASLVEQGIQLTPQDSWQRGRATYIKPLDLWDKDSGNLTSFSSNFSFVIDSKGSTAYADGLAFFLAPVESDVIGFGFVNESTQQLVAVEFDTFVNEWDPPYTHVGINIISIRSFVNASWANNITGGAENNAWINYDARSKILKVDFTSFPGNGTIRIDTLSYHVDLSRHLPERVVFGFTASTGYNSESHLVKSWNFSSSPNLGVVSSNQGSIPPDAPSSGNTNPDGEGNKTNAPNIPNTNPDGNGNKTKLIVGCIVGLLVLIVASLFASYWLWKKKHKKGSKDDEDIDLDDEFEKASGPKKFSYNQLFHATSKFADEEKLGEGGFGAVYRGWLSEMNSYIAVKRVSRGSKQGLKEYASEVRIIGQLRHRNLVQLIGWCHEKGDLLLVYEFMSNGSLDFHLFKGKSILNWEARYKIAQGLTSALLYLHEEWEICVLHRDIKASNIMLDSFFNAKLGDFGLARLVDHEKGWRTTRLAGTLGYLAPECVTMGRASKEADIYSFGIVLLEIACGRKTFDGTLPEDQMRLVKWVWSMYGLGKLFDVVDPKLGKEFDTQKMECLLALGLWCVHPKSDCRPSVRQAYNVLMFEADLPTLPLAMPEVTYNTPRSERHHPCSSNATATSLGSATILRPR